MLNINYTSKKIKKERKKEIYQGDAYTEKKPMWGHSEEGAAARDRPGELLWRH